MAQHREPLAEDSQPQPSSPSQSQSLSQPRSQQRPPHLRPQELTGFFNINDVEDPLPTPPYRRYPSTSQVRLDSAGIDSPAYRSRVNLMDDNSLEGHDVSRGGREREHDVKRPTVHYPDDLKSNSGPEPLTHQRNDSADVLPSGHGSRAPSLAGTDDEIDRDEDYDWSDEEDLIDEEARFEKHMGVKVARKGWGFRRIINLLFSTLIGSTITAGLIAAVPILLIFLYYKPHPTDHRHLVTQNVSAWLFWASANIVVSWGLGLFVDIIPAIFTWAVFLIWGHVTEIIKTRVELYNSVKDAIKPVFYAASFWVSWVILFGHIYELYDLDDPSQSRAKYAQRVYEAIEFLFFVALVFCAVRMLSHMIAFAFHRTAFQDRVDTVRKALKTFDHLKDYRPKHRTERTRHTGLSGLRTPLGIGIPGLSGAAGYFGHGSRPGTPDVENNGHLADSENEYSAGGGNGSKKSKGKQRNSWMLGHGMPRQVSGSSTVTQDTMTAAAGGHGIASPGVAPSPIDTPSGTPVHVYPPTPTAHSPDMLAPPHHAKPGTPGSASPFGQHGDDEDEAVVVQAAKALKTALLHDARNLTGNVDENLTGLGWNVNSAHEAKRLARSIYVAFKGNKKRSYLLPEDFYPAYSTPAEAQEAFRVFDKDNNGDITRAEIKTTVLKIYKERRFLSRSMRDVSNALRTLKYLLFCLALVILVLISLSVFNLNVGTELTSIYTLIAAASFVFKNSASNAFDAIMFLFVTHPYDTGDRCFIDDENLVVKKMGLFATIFTRSDGTETYYFNSQLFNKFITNARRSGKTAENLTMQVEWRTPLEKLDELERCMNEWLQTEENRWYEPSTSVTLQKIEFQRYLEITIGIAHNGTWQDWSLRNARKTAFHAAVNFFCKQIGITAASSPQPISFPNGQWHPYYEDPAFYNNTNSNMNVGANDYDSPQSPFSTTAGGAGLFPNPTGLGAHPNASTSALSVDESAAAVPSSAGLDGSFDPDDTKELKPMLGFLPPPKVRSTLLRARKSKGKKGAARATGVDF